MGAGLLVAVLALWLALGCASGSHAQTTAAAGEVEQPQATAAAKSKRKRASLAVHHYEYVFPDEGMYVYDIDAGQRLVAHVRFPMAKGIRGVAVSPTTHTLFISYGGDGGNQGNGSMLAYDLVGRRIIWQRSYSTGIDSMAVSPDGRRIYMPTGELSSGSEWLVIDAAGGGVVASIRGGTGPHNTIVGLSGRYVYLGGRNHDYLEVADTTTNQVVRNVGPLRSGVRPFTINGRETLAFTTATGYLGFQVSSLTTGQVLYTQNFAGFTYNPSTFPASAPSHGISLSPNERQVWAIDAPNGYVHVYDVSHLPAQGPRLLANIALRHTLSGAEEPCTYDCARDGWVQHSRDGRFVYVGDSGDVLSTATFKPVAFIPTLRQTRKMLEIDWRGGVPIATTTRSGLGYVR